MFIGLLFVNSKKCRLGIGYINTIYSNKQVWTIARYNNKKKINIKSHSEVINPIEKI